MSNTIQITGNAGRDAELKYLNSGVPVLEVNIADTPRRKTDAGWEDAGPTVWFRVSVWGPMAEALAPVLVKGAQVTVTGTLTVREYEKDGQTRTSMDVRAETVGVREKRGASSGGGGFQRTAASAPADDPWAKAAPTQESTFADEPPF